MMISKLFSLIIVCLFFSNSAFGQGLRDLFNSKPEKVVIETDSSITNMLIARNGKGDTLLIEHYLHGKLHGRLLETRSEFIKTIETHYYKGLKHGPRIQRGKKGRTISEVNYFMGKLEGEWKSYDENHQLEKVLIFRNDSRKQKTLYFDDGGIKEVAQFVGDEFNGKSYTSRLHGILIRYFQDGSKRQSQFNRGFATGKEKRWNAEGILEYESFMLNDSSVNYLLG